MKIRVGTRKSKLAVTQTNQVLTLLKEKNPHVDFELVYYRTTGDKLVNVSLQDIGGKGVFVKDIEQGLINGDIDIAIHSLKDVPSILPNKCHIGAYPKRVDYRDCLIFNQSNVTLDTLPKNSVVGTSSLRRKAQILKYRPDLIIKPLRGNIDTRIEKVKNGEYDAIILAMAGLHRMGWLDHSATMNIQPLSEEICIPAISQGILAIESCVDNIEINKILNTINDETTKIIAEIERDFLRLMNGDCTFPIGALASQKNNQFTLKAMLASEDMNNVYTAIATSDCKETLAQKVADLLQQQGAFGVKNENNE